MFNVQTFYDVVSGLLILFVVSMAAPRAVAQQPVEIPFADPSRMLEQMFGESDSDDRKVLEKIEVSIEEERQLGEQILTSGLESLRLSGIKVLTQGRDVEYLESLVATLRPQMRHHKRYPNIRVLVAQSPKIDARSCPGGTLLFYEGLLDAAGSEAALVGIVGHELSHLDRGHQLLPIKRIKLMEQTFSSPENMAQFMKSGPAMTNLWARPFRPEDERDADRDGVAWAYAAGYDPREMAKLFQKKGTKAGTADGMPWATFFRSHPYDHERQQAILAQFNQLKKQHPPKAALVIGKENLQNRWSVQQSEAGEK